VKLLNKIIVGRLGDAFGIAGWSHLHSFTDPHDNIFNYKNWQIEKKPNQFEPLKLESYKPHGNGYIVKIPNCNDRDQALLLKGKSIAIERSELPALKKNEYYWSDLIGLNVVNTEGKSLGAIDYLFETGSNDVIVTKTRQFIPYLKSVIIEIDLKKQTMIVNWEIT